MPKPYGFGSKPHSPFVHIKIAGIHGSVHPTNIDNHRFLPKNILKYLVGGFNPPEKYEFASWDDDIPN